VGWGLLNILLIVVDCLRADHVSAYGYKRQTTPNIDKLAKRGVLFKRAYTQSTFTLTSATSILTGLYPEVHGVLRFQDKISDDAITLPRLLRRNGFDTSCFQGMNYFSPPWGLADVGFNKSNFLQQEKAKRKCRLATCDEIYYKFSSYVKDTGTFFSLIWFFDLHGAYGRFLMPEKDMCYLKKSQNARVNGYDSELKYVDRFIGRIMQDLSYNGLAGDTLVIVTSDHGDIFDEHYLFEGNLMADSLYKFHYFKSKLSRNGYLNHLGVLPYEEVIHVPLIMKFPKDKYKGEIDGQVELIDIFPTILQLLKRKRKNFFIQGRNLIPLLDNNLKGKKFVYCYTKPWDSRALFTCVKDARFKFIKIYPPEAHIKSFRKDPKSFIVSQILAGEKFFETITSEKVDVSNKYPFRRNLLRWNLLNWRGKNRTLREKIRIKNVTHRLKI
jgi:arylsulfatase A-like enzyme